MEKEKLKEFLQSLADAGGTKMVELKGGLEINKEIKVRGNLVGSPIDYCLFTYNNYTIKRVQNEKRGKRVIIDLLRD